MDLDYGDKKYMFNKTPPLKPCFEYEPLFQSQSSGDAHVIVYRGNSQRRNVKRANVYQLDVLNQVFEQTFFPSTELRAELGKQLGMSPRTVQIWFQNKRQSIRTRQRMAAERQQPYAVKRYM